MSPESCCRLEAEAKHAEQQCNPQRPNMHAVLPLQHQHLFSTTHGLSCLQGHGNQWASALQIGPPRVGWGGGGLRRGGCMDFLLVSAEPTHHDTVWGFLEEPVKCCIQGKGERVKED